MALAGAAIAETGQLTGLDVRDQDKGVEFFVKGDSLSKPRESRAWGGTSWLAEFDGNLAIKPVVNKAVNKAGVKSVSVQWFSARPPRVRVHLKLENADIKPVVKQIEGGWSITVGEVAAEKVEAKPKKSDDELAMEKAIKDLNGPLPAVPKPAAENSAFSNPPAAKAQSTVDLDFVNTDVLQVLKALSIQSGMNIIASPDVSPSDKPVKITASLTRVSLDDALGFVTAMSNLRYAKIGNTFVVTPAADFVRIVRQMLQAGSARYDTKVVNLISGEAAQIRDATLTAHPQDGRLGFYDVIIPAQQNPNQPPQLTLMDILGAGQNNQNNQQNNGQAPGSQPKKEEPQTPSKSYYVMLVGEPSRVAEVAQYVQTLDAQIARSYSVNRISDMGSVVIPIISGQTDRIKEMLERILASNPRRDEFSLTQSTLKDASNIDLATQVILMMGPNADLEALKIMAMTLDEDLSKAAGITYNADPAMRERTDEIVDLRFVEPVRAEFMLKNRVPGLYVTLLPDPVSPGITGEDTRKTTELPTGAQGGGQATQGENIEQRRSIGIEPMKLWLRGTPQQIEEGKRLLALIDVAPKQVAFELRVIELTKEDALRLGIDWSILNSGRTEIGRVNQNGNGVTSSTAGTISGSYVFKGIESLNLLAQLDKSDNGLRYIARPNGLTTDGRPVSLFVGDTVRYIETLQTTQNGTTVQIGTIKVGVNFKVTPRLGSDGNMAMSIDALQSILQGYTPVPGGGQIPQTSDREVNLFANIKSGETLVLGGLIQESDRNRVSGIPLLKDLPIIGQLFKRTEKVKNRTEVVFFLTAVEVGEGTRENAANPRGSEERLPDPITEYQKSGGKKGN